jgi:hypothetical protein
MGMGPDLVQPFGRARTPIWRNRIRFEVLHHNDFEMPDEEAAHLHNVRSLTDFLVAFSNREAVSSSIAYAINRQDVVLPRSDIERLCLWIVRNDTNLPTLGESLRATLRRSRLSATRTSVEKMFSRLKQSHRRTWKEGISRYCRGSYPPPPTLGEAQVVMCNYLATS